MKISDVTSFLVDIPQQYPIAISSRVFGPIGAFLTRHRRRHCRLRRVSATLSRGTTHRRNPKSACAVDWSRSHGDQLKLRIDPNTGYSPEVCLQLARDLEPYELEYFEQSMDEELIDDSARIGKLTNAPLPLNESVTSMPRVRQLLDCDAADVLLPDTPQCGGIRTVKLVADVSASASVPCLRHCSHDLGPKTAATPIFSLANDCTYYGLEDDVITESFQIEKGYMRVPDEPGLGIEVDLAKVKKYQCQ